MSSTGSGTSPTLPPPKQIRFVNNEGQPPAKRRRINAACRTCRKRKTRCDGKRPLCSTCTENGHQCLGFADVGEGKKERKGSDANRTADGNTDEYEEDSKSAETEVEIGQQALGNGSPELRRSETQSYFDHVPKSRRGTEETRREGIASNFAGDDRYTEAYPEESSPLGGPPPLRTDSHRVPYFRYFGPTAIVPGFKQMVVSVREHRAVSSVATPGSTGYSGGGSLHGGTPSQSGTEPRSTVDMPIYDQTDPLPVNRLIIHLVETFFAHLGCNYPFLRQKSFTQRVEERSVEAILVDAVCALAARFSDHPLLTAQRAASYPKSAYGHVFAQRAKAAVVDTFPCPTVAAVQACLLLAYEGFGSNQDSALWMYLGCAIRMAVDLGLQKLDGVKHQGQKDPGYHRSSIDSDPADPSPSISTQEKKEIEQGRIDTLWAVFMLDRVISSGTGRPVTLRDEYFELTFPTITASTQSCWPKPFPALIQIIHLYGRVSDLLNNIKDVNDVTPKKIEGLASMEKDLTQLYQKLDQRLNFNAANFQHYCKSGEGTNFILVHFWFHTLIMLLHQPTLMHSFESEIISLLPNSRELSMSSAKTIADILAFAELIDPRSFIGNPFTSQPMYIAACAFLMESAAHSASQPSSRDISPPGQGSKFMPNKDNKLNRNKTGEQKQKHSLLVSAANQNYQRCYKALQQLETYWAGARYILVALDQKAKGIWDPETYTDQEYQAAETKHGMIPNWRRKLSLATPTNPSSRFADLVRSPLMEAGSPTIGPSQAIGWSLTGTTNSPNSNLTFMYQNLNGDPVQYPPPPPQVAGNMIYDPIRSSLPESTTGSVSASNFQTRHQPYPRQQVRHYSQPMPPPAPNYVQMVSDTATTSDAAMLLGLQNPPFPKSSGSHPSFDHPQSQTSPAATRHDSPNCYDFPQSSANMFSSAPNGYMGQGGVGDMMMESQEIDMSTLGGDMIPWLEYLPPDVLNFFDSENAVGMSAGGSITTNPDLDSG